MSIEPSEPTHVVGYALTFVDGTVLHEPVEIGTHDGCRKIMQALPEWDWPLEVELKDWGFFIVTLEEFDAIQLGNAA